MQLQYTAYYYGSIYPLNFLAYSDDHAIQTAKAFETQSIILKSVYVFDTIKLIWSIENYINDCIIRCENSEKRIIEEIADNHNIGKPLVSCAAKSLEMGDYIARVDKYICDLKNLI